jgi:uncharacterized protein YndB with AHSA1/START domain
VAEEEAAAPTRSIVASIDIKGYPIEKIWRAITDSECIALWFMKNDLKPD